MVNAHDFGNGKTLLWAFQVKWRTDILRYGDLRAALAHAEPGTAAWHDLSLECSKTALDLYGRAAQLELDAQCSGDGLAKEADDAEPS